MSVIDKVFKYGPNWENQRQDPQIEHINIFCSPMLLRQTLFTQGGASMNQHPPAHQLRILSTGWGEISHLMVECALTFSLGVFFFGWFFFPKLSDHLPSYILPTFLALPID